MIYEASATKIAMNKPDFAIPADSCAPVRIRTYTTHN